MTALVDGDIIVYRAGFAVEKTKYLVEEQNNGVFTACDTAKEAKIVASDNDALVWSRKDLKPVEDAFCIAEAIMVEISNRYGDTAVYLSPVIGNFRDRIATRAKYKGNRDQPKPSHFTALREYLALNWNAQLAVGQEADDCIGIAMSPDTVCVSIDKDLDQLAGLHYDWTNKTEYRVSEGAATRFFYQQVLSGDSTDNVPGIEGIGPKKSAALLEGVKSHKQAWEIVLREYAARYGANGKAFAIETAQLVYVRRKEGEIWQPPI